MRFPLIGKPPSVTGLAGNEDKTLMENIVKTFVQNTNKDLKLPFLLTWLHLQETNQRCRWIGFLFCFWGDRQLNRACKTHNSFTKAMENWEFILFNWQCINQGIMRCHRNRQPNPILSSQLAVTQKQAELHAMGGGGIRGPGRVGGWGFPP